MSREHQHALPFEQPATLLRLPPPISEAELAMRAKGLCGHSVGALAKRLGLEVPDEGRRAKGFVGQLVERALGADPKAGDSPDFPDLGVELKTIPLKANGKPSETTFCCSITMHQCERATWQGSRLQRRLQHVLFMPVQGTWAGPINARTFGKPILWRPQEKTQLALRQDWEELMGAIAVGEVPSPRQGKLLQVRPKAAHSRVRTVAPSDDGAQMALPLGFYLRQDFTWGILAGYY